MNDGGGGNEDDQVLVRFVTRMQDRRLVVPAEPTYVPASLRRRGLSAVVNAMLGREAEPVAFDFVVRGKLLRAELSDFLRAHGVGDEGVVEIEYVEAARPPELRASGSQADWVRAVAVCARDGAAVSAGYAGAVRLWGADGSQMDSCSCSDQPVASVASADDPADAPADAVLAGGKDGRLLVLRRAGDRLAVAAALSAPAGAGAVEAVARAGEVLLAGRWSGAIDVWADAAPLCSGAAAAGSAAVARGKAKRARKDAGAEAVVARSKPRQILSGHALAVTCLEAAGHGRLCSGSLDMSARLWDLDSGVCLTTLTSPAALFGLSVAPGAAAAGAPLILTAHADGGLRLWDPRADSRMLRHRFASHRSSASSVLWRPGALHGDLFASASYDGSIKVWDVRSEVPLSTLADAHGGGKIFGLAWTADGKELISGGEDGTVKRFAFKD